MTRAETGTIMRILEAAYPAFYARQTDGQRKDAVLLWEEMFADEPLELVKAGVKALIATDEKGFPPTIGALKAKIRQITTPEPMAEGEAWSLIRKAIQNSAYNAQREFNALPPLLQACVGAPEQLAQWAMMPEDTVGSVVASNVMRSYRAKLQAEKDWAAVPDDVKQLAYGMGGGLMPADWGRTTTPAEFEAARKQGIRRLLSAE